MSGIGIEMETEDPFKKLIIEDLGQNRMKVTTKYLMPETDEVITTAYVVVHRQAFAKAINLFG